MIRSPGVPAHGVPGVMTRAARLFGVDAVQVDGAPDAMRGRMYVDRRHRGPDGQTAVGALGVLADEVLGFSLIASLPPRSWTVSTEIWLDVVRPLPADGVLVAEARTVSVGSFAVGRVLDEGGGLVAECRERGRRIEDFPEDLAVAEPSADGSAGADHLADLLGLGFDAAPSLRVTPELENPRRMLHGGVSLAACEVVASWSRARAGSALHTSSVHVVHTRPAPYGASVEFEVRTVHAGRSLWVTEVAGTVDGRVCVAGRVTAQ